MKPPRPLPWQIEYIEIQAGDGIQSAAHESPVTVFAERAVNAFHAMLAVAQAAKPIIPLDAHEGRLTLEWIERWQDFKEAIAALDSEHPGWRDWDSPVNGNH